MSQGTNSKYSAALASLSWPIIAIFGGLTLVTGMIGPAAIPIWGVVCVFGWLSMHGPVGKAIADRINAETDAELPVPEEIYAELDDLRTRMLEMEERQEFSERMIAGTSAGTEEGAER